MYQSKYEWKVRRKSSDMPEALREKFKLNSLEQAVLENRGYTSEEDLERIYHPKTYDAGRVHQMEEAVERIEKAFRQGDSILIYGDFDADGISSTVLLLTALKRRHERVEYFIPNRIEDGYGPNRAIFEEIVVGQYDLVITVDNGVSGKDEIDYLKDNGVDVIVVDHHAFPDRLPEVPIIHPNHPDGAYPFKALAGVGIVYKLVEALGLAEPRDLSWVAIGTVADLVPMIDENKRLTIEGLKMLNQEAPPGVRALLRSAGHEGQIDEETIAFTLAPRLNATGRLGEAEISIELLLEEDAAHLYEQAVAIEDMNTERKGLVNAIFEEADRMIDTDSQINIVHSDGWHPGVLGIVASRIVEKYGKPAIVMSLDEDTYRGSARSIEGVDLHGVIGSHSSFTHHYGGHAMALGIEVKASDIDDFRDELKTHFAELELDLRPIKYIDYQIKPGNMSMREFERFDRLKPFGQSFQAPVFIIASERIGSIRQVGKDKSHIKLSLPRVEMDVIGFGSGHLVNEVSAGDEISLVGTVNINEFNQKRSLQLMLQDAGVDSVQLIDMRSRTDQRFEMIDRNDVFVISEDREKKGDNYYHFGEVLPFTARTIVLRDLPESLDNMAYSLKDVHASKIIMIFHTKAEIFFTGIPGQTDIAKVHEVIDSAENGTINLARHAPALGKKLGMNMQFLKMTIDIMVDLGIIELKDGIVYKVKEDMEWHVHQSAHHRKLAARLEAEKILKMSSSNELKDYLRTLISN